MYLMLLSCEPIIFSERTRVQYFFSIEGDVSYLIKFAANLLAAGGFFSNRPNEKLLAINELTELIATKLNIDLKPILVDGMTRVIKYATNSENKIRDIFCYKTSLTLDGAIDPMIDYIQHRRTRKFNYNLPIEIFSSRTPKTRSQKIF